MAAPPLESVRVFMITTAPVNGVGGSGAGQARVGDLLIKTTATVALYVCTQATASTGTANGANPTIESNVTWTAVP